MRAQSLIFAVALGASFPAPSAAQTPARPSSNLGSPPEAFDIFSADYKAIVTAALPRVTAAELSKQLRAAIAEEASQKPLAIREARAWAALFKVDVGAATAPADELVDTKDASYLVATEAGRLYMTIRRADLKTYPRDAFKPVLAAIRRAHEALAQQIGIPSRQVFFTDFRETLAQSTPQPGFAGQEGPIESAGATTTILRAVGGLLVDGSFVRMSSVDAERVEMVDVRWPRVRLAPEIDATMVIAPEQLSSRLVERIASDAKGQAVNVRMAVVLRPLQRAHRSYFVPSLRVAVIPRSERLQNGGYRTDSGHEFSLSLVAGLPELEERDERELVPGTLKPREKASK